MTIPQAVTLFCNEAQRAQRTGQAVIFQAADVIAVAAFMEQQQRTIRALTGKTPCGDCELPECWDFCPVLKERRAGELGPRVTDTATAEAD